MSFAGVTSVQEYLQRCQSAFQRIVAYTQSVYDGKLTHVVEDRGVEIHEFQTPPYWAPVLRLQISRGPDQWPDEITFKPVGRLSAEDQVKGEIEVLGRFLSETIEYDANVGEWVWQRTGQAIDKDESLHQLLSVVVLAE